MTTTPPPEPLRDDAPLLPQREAELRYLAEQLQVPDTDPQLLNKALIHSSYLNENNLPAVCGNERLEFLGDSVLGLITTEYLYATFPQEPEGTLSKIKAVVVSARILSRVATELNLGDYLYLGRGEELSGGRERESILACATEAVIGAVYLSCGLAVTQTFVLEFLCDEVDQAACGKSVIDYKSSLQEKTQQYRSLIPRYKVVHTAGPDHQRVFDVEVRLGHERVGQGQGKSRKAAEQRAARNALDALGETWSLQDAGGVEGLDDESE